MTHPKLNHVNLSGFWTCQRRASDYPHCFSTFDDACKARQRWVTVAYDLLECWKESNKTLNTDIVDSKQLNGKTVYFIKPEYLPGGIEFHPPYAETYENWQHCINNAAAVWG